MSLFQENKIRRSIIRLIIIKFLYFSAIKTYSYIICTIIFIPYHLTFCNFQKDIITIFFHPSYSNSQIRITFIRKIKISIIITLKRIPIALTIIHIILTCAQVPRLLCSRMLIFCH